MFSLFRRKAQKQSRDIEEVLFEVAEFGREEDLHHLYNLLKGRQVYFPLDKSTIPTVAHPGQEYTVSPADRIRIPVAVAPDGGMVVPAATYDSAPMLQADYAGMDWAEFLRMALQIENAAGVLVQGKKSWLIIERKHITNILNNYLD